MRRRLGPGPLGDVVAVLATFLVLGAVCGVVWFLVVEPAHMVRVPGGFQAPSEIDLARRFNPDGWYSVIAIVGGFLAGLGVSWWRSRDFLLTTVLLVPGAVLAAAVMAFVGRVLGPADPRLVLAHAPRGQIAPLQLMVTAKGAYLVWPIAVLFGALMVLWSSPGTTRGDEDGTREDDLPAGSVQDHDHTGI